jgi:hypothetical protein
MTLRTLATFAAAAATLALGACASNEAEGGASKAATYERPYTPTGSNVPRRDPSQVPADVKQVDKNEADKILNRPRGMPGGG